DCSATPCTRGDPLVLEFPVHQGSPVMNEAAHALVAPALVAGFQLEVDPTAETLGYPFYDPKAWDVAFTGLGDSVDPSITSSYACEEIPSQTNGFEHYNLIHWCNPEATRLMRAADATVDPAERLALMDRVYELQAQDHIGLPLFAFPQL